MQVDWNLLFTHENIEKDNENYISQFLFVDIFLDIFVLGVSPQRYRMDGSTRSTREQDIAYNVTIITCITLELNFI